MKIFKANNVAKATYGLLLSVNKLITRSVAISLVFLEGALAITYSMFLNAKLSNYMSKVQVINAKVFTIFIEWRQ